MTQYEASLCHEWMNENIETIDIIVGHRPNQLSIVIVMIHMKTIPTVRLTCIACFSPISQSILNRFWWNFPRTIFESRGDYGKIFIKKYFIVQKLDYLTCSKFLITTFLYKTIKLVKLKFVFSPVLHYMPDGLTFLLYYISQLKF